MKKKLFSIFIVAVLLFTACSDKKNETESIQTTSLTEATAAVIEEKPWYSTITELTLQKEYDDFSQCSYLGSNDRYVLLESAEKLVLVDKSEFSIVTADKSGITYSSAVIADNQVVAYSKTSKKVYEFDVALKQLGSFDLSGYYDAALDSEGTIYASNDDGIYKFQNVFDSEKLLSELLYTRGEIFYMESENDLPTSEVLTVSSHYLYVYRDESMFCVDLDNDLNYSSNCKYDYQAVDGKLYFVNYRLSDSLQPEKNYLLPYVEKLNTMEFRYDTLMTLSAPDEYIKSISDGVITTDGGGIIRRYSEEDGKLLSAINLGSKNARLLYSCNTEKDDIIRIFIEYSGKLYIFDWDSTTAKTVDTRENADTIYNAGGAIEKLKEDIEQKYGVNIYYGADAVGSFSDYDAALCEKDIDILNALVILDRDVFSYFPDGFFRKMIDGTIVKSYDIYLAGSITCNNEYGLSSAGGVTNVEDDRQIMLLDIQNSEQSDLEITIAHETWHTIEAYVSRISLLNPDAEYFSLPSFSYWYALNPKDFYYLYDYSDDYYSEGAKYTIYAEDAAPENIYFIDTYAKINELEDKARLFETIFSGIRGEYGIYESEPLMTKARFMSAVVREAFEIPDSTELIWEKKIGKVEDYAYYKALEEEYYSTAVPVG